MQRPDAFGSRVFEVWRDERISFRGKELGLKEANAWADKLRQWAVANRAQSWSYWPFGETRISPNSIRDLNGSCLMNGREQGRLLDDCVPPFLWEEQGEILLCIPSFLASKEREGDDDYFTLLLSIEKLEEALGRLCKIFKGSGEAIDFEMQIIRQCGIAPLNAELSGKNDSLFHRFMPSKKRLEAREDQLREFCQTVRRASLELGVECECSLESKLCRFTLPFQRVWRALRSQQILGDLCRKIASAQGVAVLSGQELVFEEEKSTLRCCGRFLAGRRSNAFALETQPLIGFILFAASLRAIQTHGLLIQQDLSAFGANPAGLIEDALSKLDGVKPLSEIDKIEFSIDRSENPAWVTAAFCVAIADSIQLILDEVEDALSRAPRVDPMQAAKPVLDRYLSYSLSGAKRAAEVRGFHLFTAIGDTKTARVFQGVVSEDGLRHRMERQIGNYVQETEFACRILLDLFQNQILPEVLEKKRASLKGFAEPDQRAIDRAVEAIKDLEKIYRQTQDLEPQAKGRVFCDLLAPRIRAARQAVEKL